MTDRERMLCEAHTSRSHPADCPACSLEQRLTILTRRVETLEAENEQLRETLAELAAAAFDTRIRTVDLADCLDTEYRERETETATGGSGR